MKRDNTGAGAVAALGQTRGRDWIRVADDTIACERIEAFFSARGYDRHRHDSYAIGRTLSGVQSFSYRGAVRNSLPGDTLVLHPDEPHDGQAGSADGFHYRMIYVEPAALQRVLGGRPLPFVPGGISNDPRLFAATGALLRDLDHPIEALEFDDALFDLAHALDAAAGGAAAAARRGADYRAAERARGHLHDDPARPVTLAALEAISGRDRWALSRDFRLLFGTSPYRYLVMRRLDLVKAALRSGATPAQAAQEAGFADQSHMTRHFTRSVGIAPARWRRALVA